jgi:DNA-binding CsgD family transcriptional regulator
VRRLVAAARPGIAEMSGAEGGLDPGARPGAAQLFGRDRERALLDRLLDQARGGHGGAVVLRGEAGIGKSALLEHAADGASGMLVLRCLGVETEVELAFAGLHQLLAPVLPAIDQIPEVQAAALRGAMGIGPIVDENRFVIALAVLSLLAEAAADRPLLCIVDDAHWLDRPSADALAFTGRRLEAERIAMLLSVRDGDPPSPFPGPGLTEHTVTGLDPADADPFLVERFGQTLAPQIRDWVIEAAQGNPLALLEIPEELTPAQRSGRDALPTPTPIGRDLSRLLLERVRRLSDPVQTLLLVASTEDSGDAQVILEAAAVLGVPSSALHDAEGSGMVRTEGDTLAFRHPLLRTAIYQAASLPRRQAAHRAMVDVLVGEPNADRRAWHRAALVLYPDDEIADELERTAERAGRRSGHAAAFDALKRAAELTSSDERRARRIALAARAAWDAGRPDDATPLFRVAEPDADAETFAELRHVQGEIQFRCGNPLSGAAVLLEGADRIATTDPHKALQMLFDAVLCGNYGGDFAVMLEAGRKASALPIGESADHAPYVDLLSSMVAMLESRDTGFRPRLLRALDRLADSAEPRWLVWAGGAAAGVGDEARKDVLLRRAESVARDSTAMGALTMVLEMKAWTEVMRGTVAGASLHAEEGLRLATETGLTNSACFHRAILAWVAAVRGDATSESLAEEASATALAQGLAPHHSLSQWAVGLLHLGLGRWEDAATRLEGTLSVAPERGHPYVALRAIPDLVEAALRAGRPVVAHMAAARFDEQARAGAPDWQMALAARCRALLADTPPAKERLLKEALAFHERDRRPFNRARTLLLLGEHLRRERRRREARTPLQEAFIVFEQLGASPWADRAGREIRATGQTVRRRDGRSSMDLTIQERQIVGMVVEGGTNREVAGRLFLSPRTVEYHLRNVFSKLGISSRAELVRLHAEEDVSTRT